jgi:signal transduction histidine kinase
MFENSSKLVDLINDMLDLAKLESSRIDFALDYFDIIELIENIIAEMNPLLHNKNHKLEFNHK